jgi:enolase
VDLILDVIRAADYKSSKDISIALDPVASEFHDNGDYGFKKTTGSRKILALK